jgi:serine/threonine protein kinase/Tol biopolymer transport system component
MPLQSGSRLGPYELTAPLGAGGMGEVWRGKDTRLDRSVAVKILPSAFAEDEERRLRFEREAKTISSLNHPHICTLFDVGREGDVHFLVMELLEGDSLADRLQKGPLPLDQVVRFGAQVADALDAAHRQGIVHRDLKPGNVTLTKTGAKLLDFGLARSGVAADALSGSTEMPTEARPLTTAGTVLGTFQYMAPEQLEGQEADPRTDIFALGALLYEMATARRAFDGKSKTSLIAAILSTQPPPISSVLPVMPPALDHVVRKCLEKDPDDRWQSAKDVASELRWISEAGSQAGVPTTLSVRRRSRERIAWGLALALAAASVAALGWALHLRGALREASRPFRAEVVPPPETPLVPVDSGALALSPDGQRLAFVSDGEAQSRLAIRDLATGETKVLAGTDGATFPFWSPDSRWVAFFAEGRLRKVEATGGPVQTVCEAHAGRGGSWGRDGTIVFAPDITGPLVKVPAGGGSPAAATRASAPDVTHRNPWFLPDGRHFLFTTRESASAPFGSIAVGSVDGGEPKVLLERGSNPQHADGFLFTVVDGNLVAQRLDAAKLALEGQSVPIADGIEFYNPRDLGQYSVSDAGLAVYRRNRLRPTQLVWLDRAGRELAPVGEPSYYGAVHLSADGRTLAAVRADASGANADVWVVDLQRSQVTRATFASAPGDLSVALSPDALRLAVSASSVGGWAGSTVWIQPASGSGSRQSLLDKVSFSVEGWSPDGAFLVGETQEAGTGFDVAYVALADPSKIVHLTTSRFDERGAALSPDGRWIAYQSGETGRDEVFVTDFPAAARKWQVSRSGGQVPTWRGDGRELYFADPRGALAVAVAERGGSLDLGVPERLPFSREAFRFESSIGGALVGAAVRSPDGKRFLVARYASQAVTEPIRLVRSWQGLVGE